MKFRLRIIDNHDNKHGRRKEWTLTFQLVFSDPYLLRILRQIKQEQHGYPISIVSKLVWSQAKK